MVSKQNEELKKLLFRISQNDQKAFAMFFDLFYPKIYSFSLPIVQQQYLAEEIVQEVMLKIWNMRKEILSIKSIDNFMHVVARNKCIDLIRSDGTRSRKHDELSHTVHSTYFDQERTLLKQARQFLAEGINTLPLRQREIYTLSENENRSLEQIADILQIKKSTVKSHLKSAKQSLRKYLLDRLDLTVVLIILKLF